MLRIRDYGALGDLVGAGGDEALLRRLRELIGKPVRVFVSGGGRNCFTGLLMEVSGGNIRLLTALPSAPRCPVCGKRRGPPRAGSTAIIPIAHITAVVSNFV